MLEAGGKCIVVLLSICADTHNIPQCFEEPIGEDPLRIFVDIRDSAGLQSVHNAATRLGR